jgi:N12 class adenine-specific DNA methylase
MQKQRSRYNDTETFNREHNDSFRNYIANHQIYRDELETLYNRIFNTGIGVPVKTYPVYLEGWHTEAKTLKPHQWQSVHHLYREGKGISALGVGFGKTLAATGLHALLQQEGRITRAWFQVPNNKVKDWVKEIREVLPDRTIGFVDPEMPGYSNRDKRYALYQELAGTAYDIILMPESSAGEIQLSPEQDALITREVIGKHLAEKGDNKSARQIETLKESVSRKLVNGKTNRTICFEDFGCDALFVDEAHRYKNLFSSTLSRETGMNDGRQSAKAMSLFKKAEYIRRNNDGKNVYLFTATPLTNSPLEYYNMLMFIAPEELERFGIHTIDGFIKNFADIETGPAYDWQNGTITQKKILRGFKNIQTLQNIFFKYTDYQNDPKKIDLKKPDARNRPNVIPMNGEQTGVLQGISAELEKYKEADKEERKDLFPRTELPYFVFPNACRPKV